MPQTAAGCKHIYYSIDVVVFQYHHMSVMDFVVFLLVVVEGSPSWL
jgi:hypothetical protein